jgi:hypothetical protein
VPCSQGATPEPDLGAEILPEQVRNNSRNDLRCRLAPCSSSTRQLSVPPSAATACSGLASELSTWFARVAQAEATVEQVGPVVDGDVVEDALSGLVEVQGQVLVPVDAEKPVAQVLLALLGCQH